VVDHLVSVLVGDPAKRDPANSEGTWPLMPDAPPQAAVEKFDLGSFISSITLAVILETVSLLTEAP